jgi:hypothetical protein
MMDEMREGSRRIADGNPAVAQGANAETFQDSSGSYGLKCLEVPTKQMRWRLIRQVVTACFATPPGGLLKEALYNVERKDDFSRNRIRLPLA